mmetsp:Transcript_69973/g.156994  ORF Transcript_69973/g.156994 Transcript_69973/m.156994 type:complete len:277 (-) Transcript_69973:103-933(-)
MVEGKVHEGPDNTEDNTEDPKRCDRDQDLPHSLHSGTGLFHPLLQLLALREHGSCGLAQNSLVELLLDACPQLDSLVQLLARQVGGYLLLGGLVSLDPSFHLKLLSTLGLWQSHLCCGTGGLARFDGLEKVAHTLGLRCEFRRLAELHLQGAVEELQGALVVAAGAYHAEDRGGGSLDIIVDVAQDAAGLRQAFLSLYTVLASIIFHLGILDQQPEALLDAILLISLCLHSMLGLLLRAEDDSDEGQDTHQVCNPDRFILGRWWPKDFHPRHLTPQ